MKKLYSILDSFKKGMAYGERIKPVRDWLLLLLAAIVLLVASIGWNVLLFNQFQDVKSATSSTTPQALDKIGNSITQVQSIFQQRAAEEENYQKTYHFVDPSLSGA
jgi:hypothetical protein